MLLLPLSKVEYLASSLDQLNLIFVLVVLLITQYMVEDISFCRIRISLEGWCYLCNCKVCHIKSALTFFLVELQYMYSFCG